MPDFRAIGGTNTLRAVTGDIANLALGLRQEKRAERKLAVDEALTAVEVQKAQREEARNKEPIPMAQFENMFPDSPAARKMVQDLAVANGFIQESPDFPEPYIERQNIKQMGEILRDKEVAGRLFPAVLNDLYAAKTENDKRIQAYQQESQGKDLAKDKNFLALRQRKQELDAKYQAMYQTVGIHSKVMDLMKEYDADYDSLAKFVVTGDPKFRGERKAEKTKQKISAETSYIPIGDNKFQYMSVNRATGETTPIIAHGEPVILTEKQVLIAEGKKAQSLINPFETKFMGKLGRDEATRLTELKKSAVDSRASINIINRAREQLDAGMYTGSLANVRKNFDKYLQEAGVYVGGRKAANTEAYASMMGLQVGKIIKQFGAGTGLSDADREYAENIVGGRVTLTEDAIRQLLDINERMARFSIQEYNDQIGRSKRGMSEKDYLQKVDIPPQRIDYSTQQIGQPPSPQAQAPSRQPALGGQAQQGNLITVTNPNTGEQEVWNTETQERVR